MKEFDIMEALSKRKPLRKTSTALVMHSKSTWVVCYKGHVVFVAGHCNDCTFL